MNRTLKRSIWATALVVAVIGCNPASLSYFLFKGDGKAPADYPLKPAEGRKDVSIAIMIAAPNAPVEFAGIERDVTRNLSQMLMDQTRDKRNPIRVIDTAKVDRFKMTTPGWKAMTPAEIGRQLGADYVLDATITSLRLYEPGTGVYMYQGAGSVEAVVTETVTGREHSKYAVNVILESKASDALPLGQYKGLLVQRIADELSWKHLPHVTDRRVAPVQ